MFFYADLIQSQAFKFMIYDPASERFGALTEQLGRGAAQDEKSYRGPFSINQHSQNPKKAWQTLDFVDHDEPLKPFEGEHRVAEPCFIFGILQVEIMSCPSPLGEERAGQGGLPDLSCPDDAGNGCAGWGRIFTSIIPSNHRAEL
jgi:hypothetical protein